MPESNKFELDNGFEVEVDDLDPAEWRFARLEKLFLRWQRPEHRHIRRWMSAGIICSLVLILLVALLSPSLGLTALVAAHWPLQTTQPAVAQVQPSFPSLASQPSNGILCPVQAAWSPNSKMVAVLGYTQLCTQEEYVPAQVDLFDASTAHQVAHWQPNQAILEALEHSPYISPAMFANLAHKPTPGQSFGASPSPAIEYQQLLWSPDGSQLALSFFVVTRPLTYIGVFLARKDGSLPEVLLQPVTDQSSTLIWNLQRRKAQPLADLTPALFYSWDQQDQLVPNIALTANSQHASDAHIPVGNPDGGHSFTVWQPGRLLNLSSRQLPQAYLWSTDFATWSPDGRYLITNFAFTGLIEPPSYFALHPGKINLTDTLVPPIPEHDVALVSAASNAQTMSWNPGGNLLAVYTSANTINLYNCINGHLIRSLTPVSTSTLSGSTALLSWSPDGHTLLISSARWGLTTFWNTAQLEA
jgi:WD40 repeat protein